jgi:catechol 2,3-dioxygenase-like lactoylglutathione lyase family enzyme
MKVGLLHHFTIRALPDKLAVLETFYRNVLGFEPGPRPPFQFPGLWLYHDNHPVLHIARPRDDEPAPVVGAGVIDHVAFGGTGAADFRAKLVKLGVAFDEQNVSNAGYQIFIRDPIGTKLEFNFASSEAPAHVKGEFTGQSMIAPVPVPA